MKDNRRAIRRKWLYTGGFGALFLGAGICGCVESGFLKHGNGPTWWWVLSGTLSLMATVGGVVLLIKAGAMEKEWKSKK
ncbi:hypothetical protein [Maribacter sp. 2307ULW6-5]|uniref:hypothetical protein n=1 Tax=Maribacter sp. 2307ULW6-5 TaxID=3386275 RepID=UPI0039BD810B